MQQVLDTLIEQVHAARAAHRTLRIRGGGSKDFYGNRAQGDELNTAAYSGVVAYDASYRSIRAGLPDGFFLP